MVSVSLWLENQKAEIKFAKTKAQLAGFAKIFLCVKFCSQISPTFSPKDNARFDKALKASGFIKFRRRNSLNWA